MKNNDLNKKNQYSALRYGAVVIPMVVLLSKARPGIQVCTWEQNILGELNSVVRSVLEVFFVVPGCNGLMPYLVGLFISMALFTQRLAGVYFIIACAFGELLYRVLFFGEEAWSYIWPIWHTFSSFLIFFAIRIAKRLWIQLR